MSGTFDNISSSASTTSEALDSASTGLNTTKTKVSETFTTVEKTTSDLKNGKLDTKALDGITKSEKLSAATSIISSAAQLASAGMQLMGNLGLKSSINDLTDSIKSKASGMLGLKDTDQSNGGKGTSSQTYVFTVEIGNVQKMVFKECSGVGYDFDIEERVEGGQNNYTHKFQGARHCRNIRVAKEIVSSDGSVDKSELLKMLEDNVTKRTCIDMSLVLKKLGEKGKEVKRWNISHAYPVSWSIPSTAEMKTGAPIEWIEFAVEGVSEK